MGGSPRERAGAGRGGKGAGGHTKGNRRGPRKTGRGMQTQTQRANRERRGQTHRECWKGHGTGQGTGGRHPHTRNADTEQVGGREGGRGRETENRVRMKPQTHSPHPQPGGKVWQNLYSGIPRPSQSRGRNPNASPPPNGRLFQDPQAIPGPESGAQASWGLQNVTPPSVLQRVQGHF